MRLISVAYKCTERVTGYSSDNRFSITKHYMKEESKMIGIHTHVGITNIYTEKTNLVLNWRFRTGRTMNTIVSSKTIFDVMYMLNCQFSIEDIITRNTGHTDIDSKKVLDELVDWGVIHEIPRTPSNRYIQAGDKLCDYIVHFPRMSNVNVMIAVLLQKLQVKSIFYENGEITQNDIAQNIYYKFEDIGKNIIAFLQNEMKINTVEFSNLPLDIEALKGEQDIVVNSNATDWIDTENCITINTWNYQDTHSEDFRLFRYGKLNVSDDLKKLVDEYLLAVRSIDDMLYSIIGGQFS